MKSFRIPVSRYSAIAIALLAVLTSLRSSWGAQSQTNDTTAAGIQNQAPFRLRAAGNLVVVRVVVRDKQGKPVENLKKEDFRLFDQGTEQSIVQSAVESSMAPSSGPVVALAPGQAAAPPPPAMPAKFLALYFDDLNTSDINMMQVRDAVDRYLAANLQPKDRVAIFTSTKVLSDLTADPKQLHDALSRLHVSRASARECPDISYYQAQQITESGGDPATDAMKVALNEATQRCHISEKSTLQLIPTMARALWNRLRSCLEPVWRNLNESWGTRRRCLANASLFWSRPAFHPRAGSVN